MDFYSLIDKNGLIVRKKEKEMLYKFFDLNEGALITLTGRRKVGKSTFGNQVINKKIEELLLENKKSLYLKFSSSNVLNSRENLKEVINLAKSQIKNFLLNYNFTKEKHKDIVLNIEQHLNYPQIANWSDFFNFFVYPISSFCLENEIYLFLFFDEVAWYSKKNDFFNAFSSCFNVHLQQNKLCKIILASSTSSWIKKNILENKGSMYQRAFSSPIHLKPFSFEEIFAYCQNENKTISKEFVLELYLMFGGIIKYYQYLDLKKSFEFNLNFINENKELFYNERKILLESLFYPNFKFLAENILHILSKKKKATVKEIEEELNKKIFKKSKKQEFEKELLDKNKTNSILPNNLYNLLNDLKESGLVDKLNPLLKTTRNSVFFINDSFAFFEYYWMSNKTKEIKINTNDYNNWKGIAFEIFIFNNFEFIKNKLNLNSGELFLNLTTKNNNNKIENQIDLFYKENSKKQENFYLIETKFYEKNPYYFSQEQIENLNGKCHSLINLEINKMRSNNKNQNFNVFIVLISLNKIVIDKQKLDFNLISFNFNEE